MSPVDEFLELEKEASFFGGISQGIKNQFSAGGGQAFGGQIIGGASAAVTQSAIQGIGTAASKIYDSIRKKSDFQEMMELNPDLQQYRTDKAMQKRFNATYDSIRRMAPEYGRDPIMAGSLMGKMMSNQENAAGTMSAYHRPSSGPAPRYDLTPFYDPQADRMNDLRVQRDQAALQDRGIMNAKALSEVARNQGQAAISPLQVQQIKQDLSLQKYRLDDAARKDDDARKNFMANRMFQGEQAPEGPSRRTSTRSR